MWQELRRKMASPQFGEEVQLNREAGAYRQQPPVVAVCRSLAGVLETALPSGVFIIVWQMRQQLLRPLEAAKKVELPAACNGPSDPTACSASHGWHEDSKRA